jgi:hypothetical protein
MASTHASGTLQSSASNTAGSTTNSSSYDNTAGYGFGVTFKITNGATGPTVACKAVLQISPDNSTWYDGWTYTAGVANSGIYSDVFDVPAWVKYGRVQFTGNTGQTVTIEAQYQALTGI